MGLEDNSTTQPGKLVRLKNRHGGKHRHQGVVVGKKGNNLLVKPFKHGGKIEEVPMENATPWKSANQQHVTTALQRTKPYKLTQEDLRDERPKAVVVPIKEPSLRQWLADNTDKLEEALWELVETMPASEKDRLLRLDLKAFLTELLIANPSRRERVSRELSSKCNRRISGEFLLKYIRKVSEKSQGAPIRALFPIFDIPVDPPVPESLPVPVGAAVINEPPPSPVVEPVAAVAAPLPTPTEAAESPEPAISIQQALRRAIRDHEGLSPERREALEFAVRGEPHLNTALDETDLDERTAEVLNLCGTPATPAQVRAEREARWPRLAPPVDPLAALEAGLAAGSVTPTDVLRLLLKVPGIQHPTQLARLCVTLDLD